MPQARRDFLKQSIGSLTLMASAPITLTVPASTNPVAKRILRFSVCSDGHFGQPDTPYATYFQTIVDHLNAENERSGLDISFFNGDLIHDEPRFMPQVKTAFDKLTMPYYVTRGNHDKVSPAVWETIWGYPDNHVVEVGDSAFLLGSTSNELGEYVCADTRWLADALRRTRRKKHVFVLLHISQRKWTTHGIDCPQVMELIERQPNVKAIFHGHDHDEHGVKTSGGKPYLYDGHFGGNWGTAYRGYRIVDVFDDGRVTTFQYNPETNPIMNAQKL